VHAWVEPRVPTAQLGHWPRASDRLGPAHVSWARPNPKKRKKKEKRVGRIWALGPAGPNYIY